MTEKKVPFNKEGFLFHRGCALKPTREHSVFSLVGGVRGALSSTQPAALESTIGVAVTAASPGLVDTVPFAHAGPLPA